MGWGRDPMGSEAVGGGWRPARVEGAGLLPGSGAVLSVLTGKVGPCPGMWSGLIELGLNRVVYRGVGTVGWAGRLGCWQPGGGPGRASMAGTVRWLCRWASDQNGVSREGWLRRLRVGMSMEVDGSRAGRAGTREVDRWQGGSEVAEFSRKIPWSGGRSWGEWVRGWAARSGSRGSEVTVRGDELALWKLPESRGGWV